MSFDRRKLRGPASMLATAAAVLIILQGPAAGELPGRFDGDVSSTRSAALAGAFSPLADDVTALFSNPAGLVSTGGIALYGDYMSTGGGGSQETKLAGGFERWGLVFAAGGERRSCENGTVEGQVSAGMAVNLLSGSAGSFMSIGGAVRSGRISFDLDDGCVTCGTRGGRYSYNAVTADLGLMIRPLPFISFSVSTGNVAENGFGSGEYEIPWDRTVRYGAAWLHEDRFTVSYERRNTGDRGTDHFGLWLRTAVPMEIMAGMTMERVSGGVRWDGGKWRASVVFSQEDDNEILAGVSIEVFMGRPPRIYQ